MWLVMEPTHPNEHQKTLDETINLKGEGMLELSFFTSQKVYKANLGSWNIKQTTTNADTLQRGKSPFSLYLTVVFTHAFLLFTLIFIHGQYFPKMSMHHLKITSGLITLRRRANLPQNNSGSTRSVFTLENAAAKLLVQLVKTHSVHTYFSISEV